MWDAHRKHFGNDASNALYVQGETRQFNPTIDAAVIDEALADDPESATAEWLGQFRHDLTAALDPAWIDAATDTGVYERAPLTMLPEGRPTSYIAFTDPSGGSGKDSWSTRIVHIDGNTIIDDALLEIRPPFSTSEAAKRTAEFLKPYGVTHVTGDRYAGRWPADALSAQGIGYVESELTKSDIYRECIALFSSGRVRLLDNARTLTQLRMLERRVRSGGRDSIDHPGGGNDDNANALCGALLRAARGPSRGNDEAVVIPSTITDSMNPYAEDPSTSIFDKYDRPASMVDGLDI
jgi:hypothetical protein